MKKNVENQAQEDQNELFSGILTGPSATRLRGLAYTIVSEVFTRRSDHLVNTHLHLASPLDDQPLELSAKAKHSVKVAIGESTAEESKSKIDQFTVLSKSVFLPIFRVELMHLLRKEITISNEELYNTYVYPLAMHQLRKGL